MKKNWKLFAVDLAIILGDVAFFSLYPYSFSPAHLFRFTITVLILTLSVLVHFWAYTNIGASMTGETLESLDDVLQTEDSKIELYMEELKRIEKENPAFENVIYTFINQVNSLLSKEKALFNLIDLNDGKAKKYLADKNKDVRLFIIKNLKKFVKILIAYNAKSARNRSTSIIEEKGVKELLSQNAEMINLYDQLLDEVARMGNDFDSQDPGLQCVIDNLQRLRNEDEEDPDEEDDEIKLFVTGTYKKGQ